MERVLLFMAMVLFAMVSLAICELLIHTELSEFEEMHRELKERGREILKELERKVR